MKAEDERRVYLNAPDDNARRTKHVRGQLVRRALLPCSIAHRCTASNNEMRGSFPRRTTSL